MPQSEVGSNQVRTCRQSADQQSRRESEPLVTPAEVSAYIRVHSKTIIRLAPQNAVPALPIGKHWRFQVSDLIGWTDTQATIVFPARWVMEESYVRHS